MYAYWYLHVCVPVTLNMCMYRRVWCWCLLRWGRGEEESSGEGRKWKKVRCGERNKFPVKLTWTQNYMFNKIENTRRHYARKSLSLTFDNCVLQLFNNAEVNKLLAYWRHDWLTYGERKWRKECENETNLYFVESHSKTKGTKQWTFKYICFINPLFVHELLLFYADCIC